MSALLIRQRVWMGVLAAAWIMLGVTTLLSDSTILAAPMWWVWAVGNGIASLIAWMDTATRLRTLYRWATISVVAYSLARGYAYVMEGILPPGAIWLMFAALTLHAYELGHLAMRVDRE